MSALLCKQLLLKRLCDLSNVRIWDQLAVGSTAIAKGRADVIVEVAGGSNQSINNVPNQYGYTVLLEILVEFADVQRNDDALILVHAILEKLEGWTPWGDSVRVLVPSWRFVDKDQGRWIYSLSVQVQGFWFGKTYAEPTELLSGLQWTLKLGVWENSLQGRLIGEFPKP